MAQGLVRQIPVIGTIAIVGDEAETVSGFPYTSIATFRQFPALTLRFCGIVHPSMTDCRTETY